MHSEWPESCISGAYPTLAAVSKQVSPLRKLLMEWNHDESRALQNLPHGTASTGILFFWAELVLRTFVRWHPMHKHPRNFAKHDR